MAPLVVDPEALFAAGSAVVAAGGGLEANLTVLSTGCAAHTGLDAAGMVFGLGYQDAAESLLKAAAAGINACRHSGALIQQGASNYSKAEAASTLGGGAGVLQAPAAPERISAPGPPGTLGRGEPPPPLWAVVQSFVDDVWPDGDVAALRAAAGRWRGFAAALCGTPVTLNASKAMLDSQRIPEGGLIDDALSQIGASIGRVGEQCRKLAAGLDGFADEVESAQDAIRDLLHRLGSLTDVMHDVALILEGKALDEIRKIAADIEAVLHNLGREARAFERGITAVMQLGDGLVVEFEKYLRGQFTHFLGEPVGNQVATAFDTWVNANEGFVKGAYGMAQGLVDLDPRWFVLDPDRAAATWKPMTKGSPFDMLLHPEEGAEAALQNFKSLLHLDDWSTARPGLGFGENVFDAAMLFLPGAGEAGGAAEGAGAAARGAEAAADAEGAGDRAAGGLAGLSGGRGTLADIAGPGRGLAEGLEGVGPGVPRIEAPPGAHRQGPVALPPGRPPEAPVESGPRRPDAPAQRPTDAAPADGARDPAREPAGGPKDEVSAPAGSPNSAPGDGVHEPAQTGAPHPSVSAPAACLHEPVRVPVSPAEHVPLGNSAPVEPSRMPVAPGGGPPEAALPATGPHLTSPAGRPPESPAPGYGAHGPHQSEHPQGRPHSKAAHEGATQGPGDEGPTLDKPLGGHDPGAIHGLTSHDLSVMSDYTGSGYRELNSALRSDAMDASQHARVQALTAALQKFPPYHGPVIRGTNLPPEALAQYTPGEIITEDAFLSTTTNPAVARSPLFAGNVEFRIMSSTGRDISSASMFPGEQEILFPPGTKFYVMSNVTDPITGRTVIRMVERSGGR
ncbi:WXG100-like domain-containing protein [Mycobacterium bohemicum]|uniref:Uncharacterized protein n=2 Tax=Mycobacterium bohemicum TaxID=56425 RepID=A0A1X1R3Z7_MYCBE|nr:ADP-ribosyltransferase [Mycobacterium bohemicum]ORU99051.1 hypothetical protein AWB93_11410 [Mycobacterium bohemicum]